MTVPPLRVLLLEDAPTDAKLILRALRNDAREIVAERVEDGESLRRMLRDHPWDVVISDWSMPGFTALDALGIVRELDPDLPFVIASGTIGEERAVAAMRAGAHDYVLKENLVRLAPAVEREVREAAERRARRAAEAELRRHEARFRALIERSHDLVALVGADGVVRYASPAAELVLGRDAPTLVGHHVFEHVAADDAARGVALLEALRRAPGSTEVAELRFGLPDGSVRWISARAINLLDDAAIDGLVLHLSDIDAGRRAVEQLHAAEARYRRILETTNEGVWTVDVSGRTTFVNGRMAEMLGREVSAVLGQPALDFFDAPSRARAEEAQRLGIVVPAQVEVGLVRPDGNIVRALFEASPIVDESGQVAGTLGMARDITAQRRAEEALARSDEQLRHAQKMEAIGRLAGGVAHDFNNLLSVILSYASMMIDDLPADDPHTADVSEILNAGRRAAELTRQLLAFSRQQVVEPRAVNLNEVVATMERMCRRIVGEDVQLAARLAPDLGKILADPGAIEQVIMNLVVNARDAMPGGGLLTLETSNVTIDDEYAKHHLGVSPGPHVQLAVSDSGVGMDAATMQRIFEPFFTTKETGKGTGLGLSTVFGIVQQAGGSIWVYSEVGIGTTFKVLIPRVDQLPVTARTASQVVDLGGTETVLLVEDDDAVRAVARGILRRNGYTVIEASEPEDALTREPTMGKIDLLLTDLVMPKMSGPELARRIRERRPELKVLCMSGYTDDAVVRHGLLEMNLPFLNKPLVPDTLLRKLRETLAG